jgi:chromosome segregation ATPase
MEELRVLRGALNIAQSNTEAALTQVRTEKNSMLCEIAEISESLTAAKEEVSSLTKQLDTTEAMVAQALADKEELQGENRFLKGEVDELQGTVQRVRVEAETKSIENQELQVLMRAQEVEIHDDRTDLHRSKSEQSMMMRDHDEIRATFDKLRDENELLHAQVTQLQDHIANSEVRMRQLEIQAAQVPDLQASAATAAAAAAAAHAQAELTEAQAQAQVAAGMAAAQAQGMQAQQIAQAHAAQAELHANQLAQANAAHQVAAANAANQIAQTEMAAGMSEQIAAANAAAAANASLAADANFSANFAQANLAANANLGAMTAALGPRMINLNPEMKLVVGENDRFRDRVIALEEELAQLKAATEVDRSILEEQLHHAEARAEKAELVDEIEDKLRAALEEIARLESEMLNTRAEAAERDIQWQAELDALSETYAQLQAELKQRERDIEEMKEGAWLSAELQYMAKKVEEMESEAREHVGEQRRQLEKMEDLEVELMKMRAERDECVGQIRVLDEELNDEKLANKDLCSEVSSLRDQLAHAIAEKEKALEAAENYLKRTLEGQNADRDTLKGALKELGSSLETIRADKERALSERDEQIGALRGELNAAKQSYEAALNHIAELENQLEISQSMLKASLVSSSVRFGQTIENFRMGLIKHGMQQWKAYMVVSQAQSRIEELEYRVMLLQDAGKMMALKRIIGRWKNQQLHCGWQVWRVFHEEMNADSRLNRLLANMTEEQRRRALERLNAIIGAWKGDHFKEKWFRWKTAVRDGQQMRTKMSYAARRMKNAKLGMGFHTWKDFTLLGAEERALYEINELRWKLKHTWMSWMRDKLAYEVTGFAKYQTQRLFGNWKNVTYGVNKMVSKVHLILGTMMRLKKSNAFKDFAQACTLSRYYRLYEDTYDLRRSAREKALRKMSRVLSHHWLANTGNAFRDWIEYTAHCRDENKRSELDRSLRRADEQGYSRARGQFEGEIMDLRDAVKAERGLSFFAHIENVMVGRA